MSISKEWAARVFSESQLGDKRRSKRLVRLVGACAAAPGASLPAALGGARKELDACYDLLRSKYFSYSHLVEAVAADTCARMAAMPAQTTFLLISDTTTLSFEHPSVFEQMGTLSKRPQERGMLAHTTLAIDAQTGEVLGLLSMLLWTRPVEEHGIKHERKSRLYKDKESFKWQQAIEEVTQRLDASLLARCIVCFDREADVPELMNYLERLGLRFIIRSNYNRKLSSHEKKLREQVLAQPVVAHSQLELEQRGGRQARAVKLEVRCAQVTLRAPYRRVAERVRDMPVSVVMYREVPSRQNQAKAICWVLLSSEALDLDNLSVWLERQRQHYAKRWRCEEFHRCWKSDVGVERMRLQSIDSLKKIVVIKAAIATQLVELSKNTQLEQTSCLELFDESEWVILWKLTEQGPPPEQPPNAQWAYRAVAKLGGWYDSKRTGTASPATLARGLEKLELICLGASLSLTFD